MKVVYDIVGQVAAGKNNIQTTKSGRRYPNKSFERWAKSAYRQIQLQQRQRPRYALTINLHIAIDYWPGDRRTRDIPAIVDAVFHVLEKMEVVENDRQFKSCDFREHAVTKTDPRVRMTLLDLRPSVAPGFHVEHAM